MTESTRTLVGGAIKEARKDQGLTQDTLARAVGWKSRQIVSQVESGSREVRAWELQRVASAVGRSMEELLGTPSQTKQERVLWRLEAIEPSPLREATLLSRANQFALLEKWTGTQSLQRTIPGNKPLSGLRFHHLPRLAVEARELLSLGSTPYTGLEKALEDGFGVKIFCEAMGSGESAATTRGAFGAAILLNANEVPRRRAFSLAHELFHLLTWNETLNQWPEGAPHPEGIDQIERQASSFASHLLIPPEAIENWFDEKTTFVSPREKIQLVEFAREYGVSVDAAVWRLVKGRVLSQNSAENLLADPELRALKIEGNRQRGPQGPGGAFPDRYLRLADYAYVLDKISLAKYAKILELSMSEAAQRITKEDDGESTSEASTA